MSDAPNDGNVCILSDHVGMGWHRHRFGGYVCGIMYVLLVRASQGAGGINHRFQFGAWALIFCYPLVCVLTGPCQCMHPQNCSLAVGERPPEFMCCYFWFLHSCTHKRREDGERNRATSGYHTGAVLGWRDINGN